MNKFDKLVIEAVTGEDVEAMTKVMKRAFDEDTRIHLGRETGGPPGYDNGEFIRKWYVESNSKAYKVIKDNVIIGGFNVFLGDNHNNFLGNIFLDPEYENSGYGTYLWKWIENEFSDTVKWYTETPGFSRRNHNFYVNKCGFRIVRIENPMDLDEASYMMEKEMR